MVTGGAGFIGSNFVRHLLSETDHEVLTFDVLTYAGDRGNLDGVAAHPDHTFVKGNVRDTAALQSALSGCDAVVHLAAETHVDRALAAADPFVETNVGGTVSLLSALAENPVDRFVHVSTDEVYGETLDGRAAESAPLDPGNPYAATKAAAELSVRAADVESTIVRPSNNFGPRQHPEKLVPRFVQRAAAGEPLPIYGDGTAVREWTYVEDTCRALALVLEAGEPGTAYNVGTGHELTTTEVARSILREVGSSEELLTYVDDRPGHDRRYALDASRVRELGWESRWSFEAGLRRTVDHYLERDDRSRVSSPK